VQRRWYVLLSCLFSGVRSISSSEWVAVTAFPLQVEVISKVTARLFVGAPLCRSISLQLLTLTDMCLRKGENEEFRSICEQTATELLKGSFLRYFPAIFRPSVLPFVATYDKADMRTDCLLDCSLACIG